MSARRLRLAVTERAADDLRSIQAYFLEHWGVDQASVYEEAIHNALESLRSQPELGKARDDLRSQLRSHPILSHIIIYRVDGATLTVLRIVHQRMDILRALLP